MTLRYFVCESCGGRVVRVAALADLNAMTVAAVERHGDILCASCGHKSPRVCVVEWPDGSGPPPDRFPLDGSAPFELYSSDNRDLYRLSATIGRNPR